MSHSVFLDNSLNLGHVRDRAPAQRVFGGVDVLPFEYKTISRWTELVAMLRMEHWQSPMQFDQRATSALNSVLAVYRYFEHSALEIWVGYPNYENCSHVFMITSRVHEPLTE